MQRINTTNRKKGVRMRRLILLGGLIAVLASAAVLAAGTRADAARQDTKLTLVAYSTPQPAFAQLIPAFQATAAGKDVSFNQSYGASGDQARAIIAGLNADVVDLSLEPDMQLLVDDKKVAPSWKKNQYEGIITRSVVVFVVRPGNPKKLRTWSDLVKPGVQVVTPNPFTSGGARWNVLAAYGGVQREGKTKAQAMTYLKSLFKDHVVSLDSSARNALNTFAAGRGDVLLTYENEALYANSKGIREDYYIPKATLRIDNPIAVTTNSSNAAAAKAFVKFLYTPAAQKIWAQNGYRPVVKSAAKGFSFPVRPQMFTMKYFGGWKAVDAKFFDPSDGIMAKIIGQR
jgi:sulfate/thiosulfate transport system substrate-binding protein